MYVPILALPGTFRAAVSETLTGPAPVPAAASNTLTPIGAVVAAGTVTGYEIWLTGSEQLPEPPVAVAAVIDAAVVGSVLDCPR